MTAPQSRGFTLIELLVVIAIIGILAGIVLVSLGSARGAGRDAQRAVQVRQFMNALELYYVINGHYPCSVNSDCAVGYVNNLTSASNPGVALIASGVISAIPNDPLYPGNLSCNVAGGGYCYCSRGGNSYVLTVNTEQDGGGSERCYIHVGPEASGYCGGHQTPGTWATESCSQRL